MQRYNFFPIARKKNVAICKPSHCEQAFVNPMRSLLLKTVKHTPPLTCINIPHFSPPREALERAKRGRTRCCKMHRMKVINVTCRHSACCDAVFPPRPPSVTKKEPCANRAPKFLISVNSVKSSSCVAMYRSLCALLNRSFPHYVTFILCICVEIKINYVYLPVEI